MWRQNAKFGSFQLIWAIGLAAFQAQVVLVSLFHDLFNHIQVWKWDCYGYMHGNNSYIKGIFWIKNYTDITLIWVSISLKDYYSFS